MNWKASFALVASANCLVAQSPPVTTLEIEIDNQVCYLDDLTDSTRKATSAAIANRASSATRYRTFKLNLCLGDIVAVNGRPAKGYYGQTWTQVLAAIVLTPGQAIADTAGSCPGIVSYAILQQDGTPIGTIMGSGIAGRPIPPGSPGNTVRNNVAVVGGTGAFLGSRGQIVEGPTLTPIRGASMLEDPAYRRVNGGGKSVHFVQLLPMTWPAVQTLQNGPAIYHGNDFSPVSAERPAHAGETLIMSASGLSPVVPDLRLGEPFPAFQEGKLHELTSPVEVTVNGRQAVVVNRTGWPSTKYVYRIDFIVPDGTPPGMATIGLSVAWVNGQEVTIPVR